MKFAVVVYETKADMEARSDPEKAPAYWASYAAYAKALAAAGVAAGGAGLEPPGSALTIRVRNGSREVQDGPFADTKEQLGGFFVIDVPDIESATMWAARCPSVTSGSVEVRRLLPPPPQ